MGNGWNAGMGSVHACASGGRVEAGFSGRCSKLYVILQVLKRCRSTS